MDIYSPNFGSFGQETWWFTCAFRDTCIFLGLNPLKPGLKSWLFVHRWWLDWTLPFDLYQTMDEEVDPMLPSRNGTRYVIVQPARFNLSTITRENCSAQGYQCPELAHEVVSCWWPNFEPDWRYSWVFQHTEWYSDADINVPSCITHRLTCGGFLKWGYPKMDCL